MDIRGSRVNLKKKDIETSNNELDGLYVKASESEIEFENVRSNNNKGKGMDIRGSRVNMKKKDIETSNNEFAGLNVEAVGSGGMTMDLQGFTSRNNKGNGMILKGSDIAALDVIMTGVLNIYMNSLLGFGTFGTNVVVENGGSLNACLNGSNDGSNDFNDGATGSNFSGKGTYTCDTQEPSGICASSCPTNPRES
jgi:hypothetical protein